MSYGTAAPETEEVACPKCGGKTWDNRATKRNPKQPDYKCRDKACDGVIWPPRNGTPAAASAPARTSAPAPLALGGPLPYEAPVVPPATVVPDAALTYTQCLIQAEQIAAGRNLAQYNGDTVGAITSIAATLFIHLHRR